MTVSNQANHSKDRVGAHGLFDCLGALKQDVEQTIQIGIRFRG